MKHNVSNAVSSKISNKVLDKIPATIVTGFLGSGKTTLLSSVLKQASGKRIAVIVNEFGELDIDADLLRSCPLPGCDLPDFDASTSKQFSGNVDQGIYELANGCICCTVEEEFLPVMQQLVQRRDEIDHILIETSGLALPKPLVQAFNWPEIKQFCTVDAVITVVDGVAVAEGRFAHDEAKVQAQRLEDESLDHDPSLQELLEDQLSAADLVVVSKKDLLDAEAQKRVEVLVAQSISDSVKTLYVEKGNIPSHVLMGIEAATEEKVQSIHNHHDHHHAHGAHHEHAHDHFDAFVIQLGEVDPIKLQALLSQLIKTYSIFRVKGFVAIPGKPMRQVLQAVGERIDVHFDRRWEEGEPRQTRLVMIGQGIKESVLKLSLAAAQQESTEALVC